jgi:hypothetical protein
MWIVQTYEKIDLAWLILSKCDRKNVCCQVSFNVDYPL